MGTTDASGRYDPAPMLPRQTALAMSHHARPSGFGHRQVRRPHASRVSRAGATRPSLKAWLTAPGSLTARLREHGTVTVQVVFQGSAKLWRQECEVIRTTQGHVREVILSVNGQPAVWARSSTPSRAVKGPWRAIKGLGARPLAELLFSHRQVRREPLTHQRIQRHATQRQRMDRQWRRHPGLAGITHRPTPDWIRRSVFWHRGAPLQVQEAFAPWVTRLKTRR